MSNSANRQIDPKLYSGDDANFLVRQLAQKRAAGEFGAGECVPMGIAYFDEANPPLMRGDVAILNGLTSHGKTLFASTVARQTLDRLGNVADRVLLIVMTESTVESRRIQLWGDSRVTMRSILIGAASLDVIDENIRASRNQPLYFVGATTTLSDVGTSGGIVRPSTVARCVEKLLQRHIAPELIILDHAHDLYPDGAYRGSDDRYEVVSEELKQLANALAACCPLLALAQCNKDVEKRPALEAQPTQYDLKFMQSFVARARDVYSVFYPAKHRGGSGLEFPTVRGKVKATKGLFLVYSAKAREGRCAGDTLPLSALDDDGQWSNQLREIQYGG